MVFWKQFVRLVGGSGGMAAIFLAFQGSALPDPVAESLVLSGRARGGATPLTLKAKHFVLKGAQPVLLLSGIASNDRIWDSPIPQFSLARHLAQEGFDVWVGNYRHGGTRGFRSDSPPLPYHWTVEDLATEDLPTLVEEIRRRTGKTPFLVGHSMGAWVIEGYLAGLRRDEKGDWVRDRALGEFRRAQVPGVISVAGLYNLWWSKSLLRAPVDPILTEEDFYQSNYELELLVREPRLGRILPWLPEIPLNLLSRALSWDAGQIPWVGGALQNLYVHLQDRLIRSPFLNMFYYLDNVEPEVVFAHTRDGMEELGPHLLVQMKNAILQGKTESYWNGIRPENVFQYASFRKDFKEVPTLFFAGTRDRLAHAAMVRRDGYGAYGSRDKTYVEVKAGHLDLVTGNSSLREVWQPMVYWMKQRAF